MLHCHNLYHMKTGMARVIQYRNVPPAPEVAPWVDKDPHRHDHIFFRGKALVATNAAELKLDLMRTWDQLEFKAEAHNLSKKFGQVEIPGQKIHETWEAEGSILWRRWLTNWFSILAGAVSGHDAAEAALGFHYTLPLLIESRVLATHEKVLSLQLEREIHLTTATKLEMEWTGVWDDGHGDSDAKVKLFWAPQWEWGAGLVATNKSLGVGAEAKF